MKNNEKQKPKKARSFHQGENTEVEKAHVPSWTIFCDAQREVEEIMTLKDKPRQ